MTLDQIEEYIADYISYRPDQTLEEIQQRLIDAVYRQIQIAEDERR